MKNKTGLDALSKEEIKAYRKSLLESDVPMIELKRYINELQLYMDLRFKEDVLALYKKWKKSKSDDGAIKIMKAMLASLDYEGLYKYQTENTKDELGTSQYNLY